jgi:AhpD family alkylhydroperoxidase
VTAQIILRALRRSLDQIRYISPVPPQTAAGLVARVYDQVERDFGMLAPPVALHSPAPGPLAACWLMLRETLIAAGTAARTDKEAVAAGVSLGNTCPYCVTVHTAALHGLAAGRDGAGIAAGRPEAILDPGRRALTLWARASGSRASGSGASGSGASGSGAAATAGQPPFPAALAPEYIGVAVTFHYLNRMVNVFLPEGPVPPGVPVSIHRPMSRMLGAFMGPAARRGSPPGDALQLLPDAPLPGDLAWAAGNSTIAAAFARSVSAIDQAAQESVPGPVRDLLSARLAAWDGSPMGIDRGWVQQEVSRLPAADRPAGRLALLTALASHQVGPADVEMWRQRQPADRALIELTSWASMTAARHIGVWMAQALAGP